MLGNKRNFNTKYKIYFIFCIVAALCYVWLLKKNYQYIGDDFMFLNFANTENSYITWLWHRYNEWSSRLLIEIVLVNIIKYRWLWLIINSLLFSVLTVSAIVILERFIKNKVSIFLWAVVFLFIFFRMPSIVRHEAIIWTTGSINYMWPLSLLFLGYYLLVVGAHKKNSKYYTLCASLCIFMASLQEQVAVFNILFIGGSICLLDKRYSSTLFKLLFSGIIAFLIIILCPGNKARFNSEVLTWFSDYRSISLIGKVILGTNLYGAQVIKGCFLFSIFSFLIFILCSKKIYKVIGFVFFLFVLSTLFWGKNYIDLHFSSSTIYSKNSLVLFAFSLAVLFVPLICLVLSEKNLFSLFICLGILSSAATTALMGFSPTIYGSGDRVLFISFSIFSCIILACLMKKSESY